jgi:putative membrane protein
MTDLILTIVHHLLAFALAGVIAAEVILVRPGLGRRNLALLGRIDATYGGLAALLVIIGASRVYLGLKGWEFYVYNPTFWAKMAAFTAVGLLSIAPTMRIARWRSAGGGDAYVVPDAEIARVRGFLKAEIAVFALIPIFAAAMARGY